MNTIEKDNEYIAHTYARFPITLVRGKGAVAQDDKGKSYIDMGSGIGVTIFGYCDEEWIEAVTAQLNKIQHTSNLYYTEPGVELAQLLCEKSGMKKCFFGNSGAEANECCIKAARKYSFDKYQRNDRNVIISLKQSFHGRTLATLKATGQEAFHDIFGPFPDGFIYADANDFEGFKKLCDDKVCAVMMEIVQGEGGVIALDGDFVKKVCEFCNEHDILVIIDEVQTGNGRTGKMYAYQHYGVMPDLVSTAKGVAGGLPMGVCLFGEKTKDTFTLGSHGSTFGMNPVIAAGAVSIVKRIDDKFLSEVTKKGEYIKDRLSKCKNVKSVSGMGLMLGVETTKDAKQVAAKCMNRGVLPLTAKNKIRLLPPLNINYENLKQAMDVITAVIDE
ncbi:MAG: aspartate aminotransferase family protein [Clostridiales bacterium]|nr:aspartate aminotransferase family protein [Clostridiales bacterium]